MINKFKQPPKGFSLIETLVAVLILATAISGPLTIASKSLVAATVAKNQISAYFLAQDAIEYVRFARDTNCLEDADPECPTWLSGDGGASTPTNLTACLSAHGCYLDSTLPFSFPAPQVCDPSDGGSTCSAPFEQNIDNYLYVDSDGRYNYDNNGTRTLFVREIKMVEVVPDEEALVEVKVYWRDGGQDRDVHVRESIFNWQ